MSTFSMDLDADFRVACCWNHSRNLSSMNHWIMEKRNIMSKRQDLNWRGTEPKWSLSR